MIFGLHVPFWMIVLSKYMPRSGISAKYPWRGICLLHLPFSLQSTEIMQFSLPGYSRCPCGGYQNLLDGWSVVIETSEYLITWPHVTLCSLYLTCLGILYPVDHSVSTSLCILTAHDHLQLRVPQHLSLNTSKTKSKVSPSPLPPSWTPYFNGWYHHVPSWPSQKQQNHAVFWATPFTYWFIYKWMRFECSSRSMTRWGKEGKKIDFLKKLSPGPLSDLA